MTEPDLRPHNEIKKVYLPGSPGAERKALGMTLSQIKKQIKAGVSRREFRLLGLLG